MRSFWLGIVGGFVPILLAIPLIIWADSTAINSVAGGRVQTSHVNQYFNALKGNVVPRNSSGIATSLAGDLGTSSLLWDDIFVNKVNIGPSSPGFFIDVNASAMKFNVAGSEYAQIESDRFRVGGTGYAYLRRSGTRTLAVTNSSGIFDFPIVVSALTSNHGLQIVRGQHSAPSGGSCGSLESGEGFTCVRNSSGNYTVTFTNAFTDRPVCTCIAFSGSDCGHAIRTNTTDARFTTRDTATGAFFDDVWSFICIGQRGV